MAGKWCGHLSVFQAYLIFYFYVEFSALPQVFFLSFCIAFFFANLYVDSYVMLKHVVSSSDIVHHLFVNMAMQF